MKYLSLAVLLVLSLNFANAASRIRISPGDSVKLTPGEEITISCENSNPTALQCLIQNCFKPDFPYALRYPDGTSVTGLCYANIEDVQKVIQVMRSNGQCR